jgi:hypothetical protein
MAASCTTNVSITPSAKEKDFQNESTDRDNSRPIAHAAQKWRSTALKSRLLIRNDAEATLSTAPKFAESWRYRGRELLCVGGRAARAQNDSLSTAGISEHSVVEHCAGRRLTNCHFRALDGIEMRIILM